MRCAYNKGPGEQEGGNLPTNRACGKALVCRLSMPMYAKKRAKAREKENKESSPSGFIGWGATAVSVTPSMEAYVTVGEDLIEQ